MDIAFLGVRGHVLAINKETGEVVWKTYLTNSLGGSFVTLATDGVYVFAHTGGNLFCLTASTGELLWRNDLPGLGYGLASICATIGPSDSQPPLPAELQKAQRSAK